MPGIMRRQNAGKRLKQGKESNGNKRRWIRLVVIVLAVLLLASGCGRQHAVSQLFASDGLLEVPSDSEKLYAYRTLTDNEKLVYDQMVDTVKHRKSDVRLATSSLKVLKKSWQAVRCDHEEFFWVKNLSYELYKKDGKIQAIDISPKYTMSEEKIDSCRKKINKKVKGILKDAPRDGTDYDKVKYCYDTLIRTVDYDSSAPNSQNIISTFLGRRTVCQGYAYGMQYLLKKLGVSCTTVEGRARGINHAWNLVRMDGAYYYVDVTWGNSQYAFSQDGNENQTEKYINYNYLGATTADIQGTHTASDMIKLPKCTAVKDNYFVHEKLYFSEFDRQAIGKAIQKKYLQGASSIQLKFSSMDLYEQVIQYFVEDYHVADFCPQLKAFQYVDSMDSRSLLMIFPDQWEKEN